MEWGLALFCGATEFRCPHVPIPSPCRVLSTASTTSCPHVCLISSTMFCNFQRVLKHIPTMCHVVKVLLACIPTNHTVDILSTSATLKQDFAEGQSKVTEDTWGLVLERGSTLGPECGRAQLLPQLIKLQEFPIMGTVGQGEHWIYLTLNSKC